MNEWIDKVFVIGGVLLGWLLSQWAEYFKDRKSDRKKLKRLLFYLLELRHLLYKELNFDTAIENAIVLLKNKIQSITGENLPDEEEMILFFKEMIKSHIHDYEKISSLENNIDNIILEISEISPLFAYELNGQYKIKERISTASQFIDSYTDQWHGEIPENVKNVIPKPLLTTDLIEDLDSFLKKIGRKIGYKTANDVSKKLKFQAKIFDDIEQDIDKYINELKQNIANFNT